MANALLEALGTLGYIFDTPGAYTRGLLAGQPGERVSGRDMLQEWGMVGENQEGFDAGDVGGFLAEMIFDPLNVVGAGAALKTAKASRQAKAANRTSEAMRAAGAMPEDVAKLTKLRDPAVPDRPMRVFHGTPQAIETPQLSPAHAGSRTDSGWYGKGVYFTDAPEYAEDYARGSRLLPDKPRAIAAIARNAPDNELGDVARMSDDELVEAATRHMNETPMMILPDEGSVLINTLFPYYSRQTGPVNSAYLDVRNPFLYERGTRGVLETPLDEAIRRAGAPDFQFIGDKGSAESAEAITGALKSLGHDSVVVRQRSPHGSYADEIVAFDQSQIYNPYVSPPTRRVPRQSPMLSALFGYNAARASDRLN